MKTTIVFKALPMLLVLVYAVTRGLPANRARQAPKVVPAAPLPSAVTGVVQKVLKDSDYDYVLVASAQDTVWVGARGLDPKVGQQVSYRIERSVEAYESKQLAMAFEKVFFAEDDA